MNYNAMKLSFKDYAQREVFFKEHYSEILGENAVKRLIKAGFLTAPASTKYHGAYAGGLFDHSVNVASILVELTHQNQLTWVNDKTLTSPLRVGILHDLCKIDLYEFSEDRNSYVWNNDPIIKGHGVKSIIYSQDMGIQLTVEEIACIYYHMGAFTPEAEWGDYTNAVNRYPNVLWTHTADMIASHIMEV